MPDDTRAQRREGEQQRIEQRQQTPGTGLVWIRLATASTGPAHPGVPRADHRQRRAQRHTKAERRTARSTTCQPR